LILKLAKIVLLILLFNLLLAAMCLAQANQGQPSSPRITNLKKRIESGEQKAVEDFWQEVSKQGTPLVEAIKDDENHVLVTFLWQAKGEIKNVYLFSYALTFPDAIGLAQGQMTHLLDTDIWFKTFTIRNDARFSYVFSPNDSLLPEDQARRMANLQSDPFNRKRFADLESPQASVCELPKAKPQIWTTRQEGIAGGKVEQHKFKSKILNNERSIFVYTPRNYKATDKAYPLVMFFDGYTYTTMVPTPTILDNLIAKNEIPPIVAIFVDSISIPVRLRELHCDEKFSRFLVEELMPWVRQTYRVTSDPERTIVSGSSAGGLMAAFVGLKHPEIFGNVLSQSGSFPGSQDCLKDF
jgi:enterochelin esterase-like enzyme